MENCFLFLTELSKDFYSYRKNIDFNDESLLYYAPYTSYIRIYLYNMAYSEKAKNPKNSNVELNFMKIVNEKIKIESLRNEFLAGSLWNSLSNDWIPKKDFKEIEDFYYMNCTNEEFNNEIKRAIYQTKNSNTVIYFWPTDPGKISLTKDKLLHLKKKYPDILFIGIERNKNNEVWKKFISSKKLSYNAQFYLSKDSDTYGIFSGDMARAIVIDKNGYVKSSFSFFDDKYFEKHLKNLKY